MGALKIDDLLDRAASVRSSVQTERADARSRVLAALRSLEQRLQAALGGEPLRGLTNLAGDRGRFHAARVGPHPRGVDEKLPYSGARCLVWGRDGSLYVARVHPDGFVASRARDEDLVGDLSAGHVGAVFQAASDALERHIALSARRRDELPRIAALADRLRAAVEG